MPSKGWYVNGLDELLEDSIDRMKGYNRQYMRDMRSVFTVEKVFQGIDMNEYSIPDLKKMALDTIHKKNLLDPAHGGKLPILCKDKKVRYYNPEQWSETIARTRSRALQEKGLHDEMAEAGFDLVIVSIGGSGDMCKHWEGKILSISGKTPGYQTVTEAQRIHLFHFRCVHSTSPVIITEDEAGPKIWGRSDLPVAAREDLRAAMDLTKVFKIELQQTGLQQFAAGPPPKEEMVHPWLSKAEADKLVSQKDIDDLYSSPAGDLQGNPKEIQRVLEKWTGGEWDKFRKIESMLFDGHEFLDPDTIREVKILESFLDKTPKYRGAVVRATETLLTKKVGDVYETRAMSSFSRGTTPKRDWSDTPTVLIVKDSSKGTDISMFSRRLYEDEVLMSKGRYVIKEIRKTGVKVGPGNQLAYILEEIE